MNKIPKGAREIYPNEPFLKTFHTAEDIERYLRAIAAGRILHDCLFCKRPLVVGWQYHAVECEGVEDIAPLLNTLWAWREQREAVLGGVLPPYVYLLTDDDRDVILASHRKDWLK